MKIYSPLDSDCEELINKKVLATDYASNALNAVNALNPTGEFKPQTLIYIERDSEYPFHMADGERYRYVWEYVPIQQKEFGMLDCVHIRNSNSNTKGAVTAISERDDTKIYCVGAAWYEADELEEADNEVV